MVCVCRTICMFEKTKRPPLQKGLKTQAEQFACSRRQSVYVRFLWSQMPELFPGWKRPGHRSQNGLFPGWKTQAALVREFRRDYFRGGNAPASLKRFMTAHNAEATVIHFRGGNAPASLKLRTRMALLSPDRRRYFRGGNAPASLKRPMSWAAVRIVHLLISGVETPRPH